MKIQDWLDECNKNNYMMDEMVIYIPSHILRMGIGIILKKSIWMMKKNNDATNVNIWFAYLGLGSFLALTLFEPEEEKQLIKTYAPDVYQTRYVHKKVISRKFNNTYEIPSVKDYIMKCIKSCSHKLQL